MNKPINLTKWGAFRKTPYTYPKNKLHHSTDAYSIPEPKLLKNNYKHYEMTLGIE